MMCFCGVPWGILETHLSSQEADFTSAQAPSLTTQVHPSLPPKYLPRITLLDDERVAGPNSIMCGLGAGGASSHQQVVLKHHEYRCLPWWSSG